MKKFLFITLVNIFLCGISQTGSAEDTDFDDITLKDIQASSLSSAKINGSNDVSNEIPTGTIVVYQTNGNSSQVTGRYGKMQIVEYGYDLVIKWLTYDSSEKIYSQGDNLVIQGTWPCDLDLGKETSKENDFFWQQATKTERYLTPKNDAKFSVFETKEDSEPDLTITTGSPTVSPSTVLLGDSVVLSEWTVKNIGTAESGFFSNGFYLSTDSEITSNDTYLTGNSNNSLQAGTQFDWEGPSLNIPAGSEAGTYYIGILVDDYNNSIESDESNNYVSTKIVVASDTIQKPDLAVNWFSGPDTAKPGDALGITNLFVKNQGNATTGQFPVGLYISDDTVITTNDSLLTSGRTFINQLASNSSAEVNFSIAEIPEDISPGDYYIGILADKFDAVEESNENNNYSFYAITINCADCGDIHPPDRKYVIADFENLTLDFPCTVFENQCFTFQFDFSLGLWQLNINSFHYCSRKTTINSDCTIIDVHTSRLDIPRAYFRGTFYTFSLDYNGRGWKRMEEYHTGNSLCLARSFALNGKYDL